MKLIELIGFIVGLLIITYFSTSLLYILWAACNIIVSTFYHTFA